MAENYTGPDFFDHFDFFSDPDPTHGFQKYQDMDSANQTGLAGFVANKDAPNSIYLGVDATAVGQNGRPSTRIQSIDRFNHSLHIADIKHMPGGVCGTWPAYWLTGYNWPYGGEIDIMEGINLQSTNKMVLHTKAHLLMANTSDPSVAPNGMHAQGTMDFLDCSSDVEGNPGCGASGANGSYGTEFNNNGGGVLVTEYTPEYISIWNFGRNEVPNDTFTGTPNPTTWRDPDAHFMTADGTLLTDHFTDLQIVLNIALCGDWTNGQWATSECAALAPTCQDYVANNPAAFLNSFWLLGGIQVYEPVSDGAANAC